MFEIDLFNQNLYNGFETLMKGDYTHSRIAWNKYQLTTQYYKAISGSDDFCNTYSCICKYWVLRIPGVSKIGVQNLLQQTDDASFDFDSNHGGTLFFWEIMAILTCS